MKEHEVFYVVWNPETGRTRVRHRDRGSAVTEAKRLAASSKGQEFHVLASIGRALVVDPVDWVEVDLDSLIPF